MIRMLSHSRSKILRILVIIKSVTSATRAYTRYNILSIQHCCYNYEFRASSTVRMKT